MKKKLILLLLTIIFSIGLITVNADNNNTFSYIEYPINNQEVTDNLKVQGWVMSTLNTTIKAYIDYQEIELDRVESHNVLNEVKGYGDVSTNPTPEFYKNVDIKSFGYGEHILKINVLDSNENIIQTTTRTFTKIAPKTLINIDYPNTNQEYQNTLRVMGWVMSTTNTTIKAYVDNVEVTDISRQARPDVLNAIKGYGDISTNPTPGFDKYFDISKFCYGGHNFRVDVYDSNNNLIKTEKTTFRKQNPKTKVNIDMPTTAGEYSDTLRIMGWVMSTTNTYIKAYVDNVEVKDIPRQSRSDVLRVIKGYGDYSTNPTPGFDKYFDISKFCYGGHNFRVDVYDSRNNLIHSEKTTFRKQAPKTKINIDMPTSTGEYTDTLRVMGWVMSTANTNIKAYIDNVEVSIDRESRPDVLRAIKGYGDYSTNSRPGFTKSIDISNLSYGTHTFKLFVYDSNNALIQTVSKAFNKSKPKAIINIDYPTSSVSGANTRILGWYLVNSKNAKTEIYIDGNLINYNSFVERPDVYKVYKGQYGYETTKPGFDLNYDSSNLSDGKHTIYIKVISTTNNQIIASSSKTYTLKKVNGTINIDNLVQNTKQETYLLEGWEMSTDNDSYFKIYVDNNLVNSDINRLERPDVLNAIKNYGNQSVNPTPGFKTLINITNISTGTHTVKIELYSKYNEVIKTVTKRINIYSKNYIKNGDTITGLSYNVPYYNQYDYRWKDIQYGLSKLGPRGCAPTAMAMAFSGIKGIEILPNEVADYLYYNTREFNKDVPGTTGLGIIYATNYFGIRRTGINSKEELDTALQQGKIVFAAMGNGIYGTAFWNHAIILKGYSNGSTYSYDPLDTSKNIWVSTTTIWSQKSTDWDDYRGGSVFYALDSYY